MNLGPYEGIPGVSAPFVSDTVNSEGARTSGYFLDVDIGVKPAPVPVAAPVRPRAPPPPPKLPDTHTVFLRGVRTQQATQEPFTYNVLDTINEEMGVSRPRKPSSVVSEPPPPPSSLPPGDRSRQASGMSSRSRQTSGVSSRSSGQRSRTSSSRSFQRFNDVAFAGPSRIHHSSDDLITEDQGPRGRLLAAPHINPHRVIPPSPTAPKPPPLQERAKVFAKEKGERTIYHTRKGTNKAVYATRKGARKTIYGTRKGARITHYNTLKSIRTGKEKGVQLKEKATPHVQKGKHKAKTVAKAGLRRFDAVLIKGLKAINCWEDPPPTSFDYRDYVLTSVEDTEPETVTDDIPSIIDLEIPEFKERPGQISRNARSAHFEQMLRKGDLVPSPVKDDISLHRSIRGVTPPVSGLNSPALSSPGGAYRSRSIIQVRDLWLGWECKRGLGC
eukprot:sb/3464711/